ncbi:unnamed protein product [Meloidogyne enterolobii]|uniref:Uncharacterized protein n=1 Tax=Meloidogyne enterolobii TaxID=390850 RepID=A0ACB0Y3Z2_MELEN
MRAPEFDLDTASSFSASTASTAGSTSTSRCCNNVSKGGCSCLPTSINEFNEALNRFYVYQRLLGRIIVISISYMILAPLIAYIFMDGIVAIIFCFINVFAGINAIRGCYKQKISMIYPALVLHIFYFTLSLTGFVITLFCMRNTTYCTTLTENPLIRQILEILFSFGFTKWPKLLLVLRLWCIIIRFKNAFRIWTLIKMMPEYSYELHNIAFDVLSLNPHPNNMELMKHLGLHVRAQESKKSR